MPGMPHPQDPSAEICVLTGGKAYARVRHGEVRGWYGSTVADLDHVYVVLDGSIPEGPVSDDVLRRAIASGGLFDVDALREGRIPLGEVPEAVVATLVANGVRDALSALRRDADEDLGVHVPPGEHVGIDDPLTVAPAEALFGARRARGPDLHAIGSLAALALRARGREVDPDAVAARVVDRIRQRDDLLAGLSAFP